MLTCLLLVRFSGFFPSFIPELTSGFWFFFIPFFYSGKKTKYKNTHIPHKWFLESCTNKVATTNYSTEFLETETAKIQDLSDYATLSKELLQVFCEDVKRIHFTQVKLNKQKLDLLWTESRIFLKYLYYIKMYSSYIIF